MDKKTARQAKTAQGFQKLNKTIEAVQKRADAPRAKHAAAKNTKNPAKKA